MEKTKISDIHPHLKKRMEQRGVSLQEINTVLNDGVYVDDAKENTFGKKYVFKYNNYWNKNFYEEKEVKVYYKY